MSGRQITAGGNVNRYDPTLDFFDLSASFKPKVIKTSKEEIMVNKSTTAPPIIPEDEEDEYYDAVENPVQPPSYATKIKEKEAYIYQKLRQEEERKRANEMQSGKHRTSWSAIESNTNILSTNSEIGNKMMPSDGIFARGAYSDYELQKKFDFSIHRGKKLAIVENEQDIVNIIDKEQVTVVCGHTGSGKTTQIPQFILSHHAQNNRSVNIIVTQPRKIAAKSVAMRVCQERGWELGGLVGYKVGLDKEHASLDTRLLYCTTGVLKKMIIAKKHLNDWTHVILDEVHERYLSVIM